MLSVVYIFNSTWLDNYHPGPDAPGVNNYPALPTLTLKVLPSTKLLSATRKETAGHPTFPQFSSLLLILIRVLCL